ncbi:MAG: alanine racemase [Gammaproteobacteria bacterium]|nr:alanine racemase [Gammaproteobacteria bacterium]MYE53202.1 alanine racemase [Gammaproteobacteria bacterium]MYF48546.1 alanine racemase [Gammaproteobacteria bacterium]
MTARLRIDLQALTANYSAFREAAVGAVGAVVKADAYGLGAEAVGRTLAAAGCEHFFVARASEGIALRRTLAEPAIHVLEGVFLETADALLEHGLNPVLNSPEQLALWTARNPNPATIHVDTGMQRLGFPYDMALEALGGVEVGLLVTHLACADVPEHPLNALQAERIECLRERFPGVRLSIGNSAGILNGADFGCDLARPGIGLYGGNPWAERPNPMQPVATLEAQVVQVRTVGAGEAIGYGASWTAERPTAVAVLGIGYADGLPRLLSNRGAVAANNRRCPMLGRVSMDLTAIDATGADLAVGDWVEAFGPNLPVDEVAAKANTIAYEILTGISPRVERQYERRFNAG